MPQVYKTQLSDSEQDLLRELPGRYGLRATPSACERIVVWGDRIIMQFYVDESRYFLKEWPDDCSPKEEQFNLGLQAHLYERGFPVPKLLTTIDGEKLLQWRGRKISLYDYVGEAYDPAWGQEQRDACATALGQFHRVTTDFPLTGSRWKIDPSFAFSESFINEATTRLSSLPLSRASKRRVAGHLGELDRMLQKAKERLAAAFHSRGIFEFT